MAVRLGPILSQILQAEGTDHLRTGTPRIPGPLNAPMLGMDIETDVVSVRFRPASIERQAPGDQSGAFQTALFQRYRRSEKALMQP